MEWLTIWEAILLLDLAQPMSAKWYEFVACPRRPVTAIKPWRQRVRALDIDVKVAQWQGSQAELAALRRKDAQRAARARRASEKATASASGANGPRVADGEVADAIVDGVAHFVEDDSKNEDAEEGAGALFAGGDEGLDEGSQDGVDDERSGESEGSSFAGEWDIEGVDLDELRLASIADDAAPDPAAAALPLVPMPGSGLVAAAEPPPLPPPACPPVPIDRQGEVTTLELPEGKIKYYFKSKVFVAECAREEHRVLNDSGHRLKCHLTRPATASRLRSRPAQGRPLGMLMAWLHQCPPGFSRQQHVHEMPAFLLARCSTRGPSCLERGMGSDAARCLLALEREKLGEEESEPDMIP